MSTKLTLADLPENDFDGFDVVRLLREKYGWSVRVMTRADAENAYDGSDAEGELTDEEWTKLRTSRAWRDLADPDSDDWEKLHGVVYSVLGSESERVPPVPA